MRITPNIESQLLVVGLSPAWQRSLYFDSLTGGAVNRARRVNETASGKVINVARVAGVLGMTVRMITVAGGDRGRKLQESVKADGIIGRIIRVKGETRICQTLLSKGVTTELVEEAVPLQPSEVSSVLRAFQSELRRASLVVLTGSVPKGCGDDFYARLTAASVRRQVPVLIDAQGIQLVNAVRERPFAVRLTRQELADATGMKAASLVGVGKAAKRLLSWGARWVVVSDGARAVHAFSADEKFSLVPPRITARNPIGSGDSMMAGMAHGILRGWAMRDAVAYGVACGAANAMNEMPGVVRVSDMRRLAKTVLGQRL
jgi:tagatose 6-phosphate kinase